MAVARPAGPAPTTTSSRGASTMPQSYAAVAAPTRHAGNAGFASPFRTGAARACSRGRGTNHHRLVPSDGSTQGLAWLIVIKSFKIIELTVLLESGHGSSLHRHRHCFLRHGLDPDPALLGGRVLRRRLLQPPPREVQIEAEAAVHLSH